MCLQIVNSTIFTCLTGEWKKKTHCLMEHERKTFDFQNWNCFQLTMFQLRFLLDTATWPCQVKEYKIVSEPSLLTSWLAGCVVNLVSNFPFPIGHNPGARLRLSSLRAVQKVKTQLKTHRTHGSTVLELMQVRLSVWIYFWLLEYQNST